MNWYQHIESMSVLVEQELVGFLIRFPNGDHPEFSIIRSGMKDINSIQDAARKASQFAGDKIMKAVPIRIASISGAKEWLKVNQRKFEHASKTRSKLLAGITCHTDLRERAMWYCLTGDADLAKISNTKWLEKANEFAERNFGHIDPEMDSDMLTALITKELDGKYLEYFQWYQQVVKLAETSYNECHVSLKRVQAHQLSNS